jgi:hypothetical protein
MQEEQPLEEIVIVSPQHIPLTLEDWALLAICGVAVIMGLLALRLSSASRTIVLRLVLAVVSGMCVSWVFEDEHLLLIYGGGGALFATGVLFPHLKLDKSFWYRGLGLVVVASLSFFAALEVAEEYCDMFCGNPGYMPASLVGAFIVLAGARFIVPLKGSFQLVIVGLPAAVIGGLVFELLDAERWLPFAAWHCVMALAIHISESWSSRTGHNQQPPS